MSLSRSGKSSWNPIFKMKLSLPNQKPRQCLPNPLNGLPALCRWQDPSICYDSGYVEDYNPCNLWNSATPATSKYRPDLAYDIDKPVETLEKYSSLSSCQDGVNLNDSGTSMTFDSSPSVSSEFDGASRVCEALLDDLEDSVSRSDEELDDIGAPYALSSSLDNDLNGITAGTHNRSKRATLPTFSPTMSYFKLAISPVLSRGSPVLFGSCPNISTLSLSSPGAPPPKSQDKLPGGLPTFPGANGGLTTEPVKPRGWRSAPIRRKILPKLPPTPGIKFDIKGPHAEYSPLRHAKTRGRYEKRPESLVVGESDAKKSGKLAASTSITSIISQGSQDKGTPPEPAGRASSWALNFDKLLADPAGLAAFTEFLKKEFSEENIVFWTECEKYKNISNDEERKAFGNEVFERHLSTSASDPVNVDSNARQTTTKNLPTGAEDLFSMAQLQIFTLMRQDSYPRFLKSDLYKQCVVAEMEGKRLPFGPAPPEKKEDKKILKKSKSVSSAEEPAEEKRRKSLLPWSRNKSEKRLSKLAVEPEAVAKRMEASDAPIVLRGSLDLADLSLMSRELAGSKEEDKCEEKPQGSAQDNKFCRAILPDGSTTVIFARPGPSIYNALTKLCERRNMLMCAMEVFLVGGDKPLDLLKDISSLGSKEIKLEKRTLVRVELPNRKVIGVKSRPNRIVREILKPILQKYGFKMENVVIQLTGSGGLIDPECQVHLLDNQRITIQSTQDFAGKKKNKNHKEWGGPGSHRHLGKPPLPRSKSTTADPSDPHLLLLDIMDGKTEQQLQFDELGVMDTEKKMEESKARPEEPHRTGLFGFMRRNSWGEKEGNKMKARLRMSSQPQAAPQQPQQPRPPKPRGARDPDDEKFFDLLTRVQSHRLDDQRGLTARDLELPDFLKDKTEEMNQRRRSSDSPAVAGETPARWRRRDRRNSDSSLMDMSPDNRRLSKSLSQDALEDVARTAGAQSPSTHRIPFMDQSFSRDGLVPSHGDAENYFSQHQGCPTSPNFDDSHLMERSLHDIGLGGQGHQRQSSLDSQMSREGNWAHPRSTTPICKLPPRLSPRAKTPNMFSSQTGNSRPPMRRSPRLDKDPVDNTILCTSGIDLDQSARGGTDADIQGVAPSSDTQALPPPPQTADQAVEAMDIANYPPPTPLVADSKPHSTNPRLPPRRTTSAPTDPGNQGALGAFEQVRRAGSEQVKPTVTGTSPPPRPPRRTAHIGDAQTKKSLSFDGEAPPDQDNLGQVSYV